MFASIKTAITYTTAIASAIAIFSFSSETRRQQEIVAAKRRIAESKAQIARRTAEIEQELQELKHQIQTEEVIQPIPQLPDPWACEIEYQLQSVTLTPQHRWQLALPPAKPAPQQPKSHTSKVVAETPSQATTAPSSPDYSSLSIRQLKAMASARKIKGYGNLTKAQLISALQGL